MLNVVSKLRSFKPKTGEIGSPGRVISTTVAIYLFSQILAAILVVIMAVTIKKWLISNLKLEDSIFLQFVFVAQAEIIAVWFVLRVLKNRALNLNFIGLGRRLNKEDFKRLIIGFGIYYGLMIAVNALLIVFLPSVKLDQKQNLGFDKLNGLSDQLITFVALVLLPPLGEEILVRGYLYSGLRRSLKYWPAAVSTSLIFGLAHLEIGSGPLVWAAGIQTFVLSMVLVYLREKTGALYAGFGLHMLNNLIAFFVIYH